MCGQAATDRRLRKADLRMSEGRLSLTRDCFLKVLQKKCERTDDLDNLRFARNCLDAREQLTPRRRVCYVKVGWNPLEDANPKRRSNVDCKKN